MRLWSQRIAWLIISALGSGATVNAQSFDLRSRVVNADDCVQMTCALELDGFASSTTPNVRVIGTANGHLVFYGFNAPIPMQRVGRVWLGSSEVRDLAGGVYGSMEDGWDSAQIAAVSGNLVYLMRYSRFASITPQGYVQGVNASRAALLKQSDVPSVRFELAIGGTDGVVRLYDLTPLPAQPSFNTPVSLGAPKQTLVLPSNSAVHSIRYATADILVVASGQAIYRYARQSSGLFTLAGKDLRLFAPVAEMVADANRIVAASEDGYVYAWQTSNGAFLSMLKERFSGRLGAHCLTILPANRLVVGYQSARLFDLPSFTQSGEVGIALWGETIWGNNQMDDYTLRPHFDNIYYTVLPPFSSGANLATAASGRRTPRVAFIGVSPYHRRYPIASLTTARPAVYAFVAAAANRYAYGYADGQVRVYDPTISNINAILSYSTGAPIFALGAATVSGQPWVLLSLGAQGEVRAWNLTTNQVVTLINPSSTPRVIYALKVQSVAGSTVTFWTAASDGTLERWSAALPNAATLQQQFQAMNAPLWSLDINASGHVAVGGADGVRYYVGAQSYSAGAGSRAYSVAFRPTTGQLAVSRAAPVPVIELYTLGANLTRTLTIERAYRSSYPYNNVDYSPALLSWVDGNRLGAASIFGGKVRLYSLTESALYYADIFANDAPGVWDRNPVQAFEPVREGVLAFSALANNQFTVGSTSGEAVVWANMPINFSTYFLAYLTSVDFMPANGVRVYPGRAYHTPTTTHIPFRFFTVPSYDTAHAYAVRGTTSSVNLLVTHGSLTEASALSLDSGANPVAHSRIWQGRVASNYPRTTDITDSGRYVLYLTQWNSSARTVQFSVVDLHTSGFPAVSSPAITLPSGSNYDTYHVALAPGGQRFALSQRNGEVQIHTRSGGGWATPAVFTVGAATGWRPVRFIDDNRLLIAYPDGSPATWRLVLYQLSGGSWVQMGSPVDTQLPYSDNGNILLGRTLDVITPSSGNPRIALVDRDGLALYRLSGNTLQLVARALPSTSGYLEAMGYYWVRFSRHNPDRLGLAHFLGAALEVDVSGLGW